MTPKDRRCDFYEQCLTGEVVATTFEVSTYCTPFGDSIDLTLMLVSHHRVVCDLILLAQEKDQRRPENRAGDYSNEGRKLFRVYFPSRAGYNAMIGAPLGRMYRDCFYRVFMHSVLPDQRKPVRDRLRFSPLRLLLDQLLDGWHIQAALAEQAGLDSADVSRDFARLLKDRGRPKSPSGQLRLPPRRLAETPFRMVCILHP